MSKKATPPVNEFPWLSTGITLPQELSVDQRKALGVAPFRKGDKNPKSSYFVTWHHHGNKKIMKEQVSKMKAIPNISLLVCGNEKGKNKNDGHWQAVVTMSKAMRWRPFCALLKGAHVEIAKNVQACRRYCKKEWLEGSFVIDNRTQGQGNRSDLQLAAEAVRNGMALQDIAKELTGTFIRYHQGIAAAHSQLAQSRKKWTKVMYLHGPAGTGKSALIKACFPKACYMSVNGQGFVQYTGNSHSPVWIFDDPEMQPKSISSEFLKKLGNHTAESVNIKGGSIPINAILVVIICNYPPSAWNWDPPALSRVSDPRRGWTVLMDKPIEDGKAVIPKDYPVINLGQLAKDFPALLVQVPLDMGRYELPRQSDEEYVNMLKGAYETHHESLSPNKEIIAIQATASPKRDVVPETPPGFYEKEKKEEPIVVSSSSHHIFWQNTDESDPEDNECESCHFMYSDDMFDHTWMMCNDCVRGIGQQRKRRRRCVFIDDEAGESD
jgi:hypothetical protein